MPACSKEPIPGALEELCWNILSKDIPLEMKNEVEQFVLQIWHKYAARSAHGHKSRLHALFSVNEKLITLKIGEAARAGAFDWNSSYLEPLRDLIRAGFVI